MTNYRENFYPFFKNDGFYYGELNVLDTAAEYAEGSQALKNTLVWDDGVVRGFVRVNGSEVEKLFVEPRFQRQHIGEKLLRYAVSELGADRLMVLEYNEKGIRFYRRHGFELTGEKVLEDGWIPLLLMRKGREG